MEKLKIIVTLTEEMLGTASGNPDVHREYIASKSADSDKAEEEMAALHAPELEAKTKTVFPRDADGSPILWDYQFKGFLKDTINALREMPDSKAKGNKRLTKWSYKKTMDNLVFVQPRKIKLCLPEGGAVGDCQRPLRAETMQGERVALANSETVPEGTTFTIEIVCLDPSLMPVVRESLDYGQYKGIGQWRNSGKGRFSYEVA